MSKTAAMQDDAPAAIMASTMAQLRDGRQVMLRALEAHDEPALREAFAHLSADARYTRFFTAMREVPEALLEAAIHPVPGREAALVAVSADGGAECIVGTARYVGAPGSTTCEFAVTVTDDWHALGLARRLLGKLIEAAAAQGFQCMEGYVLAVNTAMRRLAKALGFVETPCPGDATLRVVRLALAGGGCDERRLEPPP